MYKTYLSIVPDPIERLGKHPSSLVKLHKFIFNKIFLVFYNYL